MLKRDYFLAAMKAGEYKRRAFVISIFSLLNEGSDDYKKNAYSYRLVQTPAGFFFVDPTNSNQLTKIDDAVLGQPLFAPKETIQLTKDDGVENLDTDIETTYGRLLFNYTVLIYAFGNKLPYQNKKVNPSNIESMIVNRIKDTPKDDSERTSAFIYVDEYLRFCDAMFFLTGLTQICVPGGSEKVITPAPGVLEYKRKLLEENKDSLTDSSTIAKIDEALVNYDKAYMKGDVGEGFLISGKAYEIVRKRLFSMHGAEAGLSDSLNMDLMENSLNEGWDVEKFPTMNNNLRAGSFNRGAQTQLGGESVKWLLRSSSNMRVAQEDCGTNIGMVFTISDEDYKKLISFYVIENDQSILIENEDMAKKYIGKEVMVRSPMFCKLDKTDYCEKCVGTRLAQHPTGLSVAISEFGSNILLLFLKSMHGKALSLSRMDYKTSIS